MVTLKRCPYCREDVRAGARVCPHCRRTQPGAPRPILKGALIASLTGIGIFLILVVVGWNRDDSPEARLARIEASCDKQYGAGTEQSLRCQAAIMMSEIDKSRDRKFRQAVKDAR